MRFYTGQKVVCIEPGPWIDGNGSAALDVIVPRLGGVYTVTTYAPRVPGMPPHDYILLLEIHNGREPPYEVSFNDKCFEPKPSRDTSAEVEKLKQLAQRTGGGLRVQQMKPRKIPIGDGRALRSMSRPPGLLRKLAEALHRGRLRP